MSDTTVFTGSSEAAAARRAGKSDQALQSAHTALDKIQSSFSDLRQAAPALLDRATNQVEDLSRRTVARARETSHQVVDQAHRASEATTGYVREQPLKALLMATAAGALLAVMMGWMKRDRS